MTDSVLRLAAEIYSPFDARETRRLRMYVADVEELVGSAFFQPGEQKLTLSAEMGGPLQSTLVYPGEEAVRAVVGLFRQLYNHHEPTSAHQGTRVSPVAGAARLLAPARSSRPRERAGLLLSMREHEWGVASEHAVAAVVGCARQIDVVHEMCAM